MTQPCYRTILADPPWNERGGGKVKRGADRHYPLLRTAEIIEVMQAQLAARDIAPDAHLYLWVTNNFLIKGIAVMGELGFRYVTNRVWAKDRFGLGYYFRGQHELLLFGVRGRGPLARTDRKNLPSVIKAPRTKHSAKPIEAYQLIEARSHGPYLEMFARQPRLGWDSWGNDTALEDARQEQARRVPEQTPTNWNVLLAQQEQINRQRNERIELPPTPGEVEE